MVKIVTWGRTPTKVGVLSILLKGNFSVEILKNKEKGEQKNRRKTITFKYHFEGDRFHMLPQSYKFYHGLGLNNFLQVLLICNQIDQVLPFIYTNWDDNVSHLVKGRRVLGGMKYLTRLVKRAMEAVGI